MKFIFAFLLSFFFCFAVQASESAVSDEWLALGHYKSKWFGGYKSSIDTDNFFLSPKGKVSPHSELMATIELFNSDDDEKKCLYPARYKFLIAKGLIDSKFPKCEKYVEFYEALQPNGVTLLFTDAYMNNPSSLFGHTLFRVDTKRKGTQLLAHGANYGAFTGEENGVLFAVYGLTGGYYGGFTVKPYYDVINMYNNVENRNIWEMRLAFDDDELDMFVAHLWEIGNTQAKYYFFSKNCSYMLLEILDAVRPSLRLSDQFPVHAIPMDTFKAVARSSLYKDLSFRPSRQAKIINQYNQMSAEQKDEFVSIVKGEDSYVLREALDVQSQAEVLETAYQFVQWQNVEGKISKEDYRKKSFKLLTARSRISENAGFEPYVNEQSPLDAHESMQAGFGFGFRNGEAFQEVRYRPAYRSLVDSSYGFLKGAEINFLNFAMRHYDERNKTVLQNLDIVGIKSLSPITPMFSPISYQIRAGIDREIDPKSEDDHYAFNLLVGTGGTVEVVKGFFGYMMMNGQAAYGGGVSHNGWAGVGSEVGIYADFDRVRVLGAVSKMFATSKYGSRDNYKMEVSYSINNNNSLNASYLYQNNYGKDVDESLFSYRVNF